MILGTGVGGAIYETPPPKEGEGWGLVDPIFRGASGGAGEFGHTTIDFNGPFCNCGSRGCIEAYLGQARATPNEARRHAAERLAGQRG